MRKSALIASLLLLAALGAAAQPQQTIVLGQSIVPLTGPWKFSPGDSPIVNGAPVWAQPGFDDSSWAFMDLTPPAGSRDPQFSTGGFIPGWTHSGYPNLVGYAWYRLRIRVLSQQPLSIEMPIDVDDAYQAFANGKYIGEFGEFHRGGVTLHYGNPVALSLPAPGPGGEIDLAIRFYMSAVSPLRWPDAGGLHLPPVLGTTPAIALLHKVDLNVVDYEGTAGQLFAILFSLLAMPLALWAAIVNRHDRAWLWLFLALLSALLFQGCHTLGNLSPRASMWAGEFWSNVLFVPALNLCWILFWWNWFDLRSGSLYHRWIVRAAWSLTAFYAVVAFYFESPTLDLHFATHALLRACGAAVSCISFALGALLLMVLVEGFRRDRTAALLATIPILLLEFSSFTVQLEVAFHIPSRFFLGTLGITTDALAAIVMMLIVGVLSMRRFLANRDREILVRESAARDLDQARQLQQSVLVSENISFTGFSVRVEYRPAQTVGGDFFQTIAQPDGSLLVIIGDVSGKGISAAMLVAVLVGAARARARQTSRPAAILAELNAQLIGRSSGHFATCIAANVSPDGTLRLANAGHIPPYLNGRELAIEPTLPLGLAPDIEYTETTLQLAPDDRITLLTDGVAEARNPTTGELFGFDRTAAISNQSAVEIAQRAQAFGQEDDITVLTLTFVAAGALA
jgi:hypothetical protein